VAQETLTVETSAIVPSLVRGGLRALPSYAPLGCEVQLPA